MPAGSRVAAVRILDQETSVQGNFSIEQTGDAVSLRWKVFDPDMAVKIAIARFGSVDPVSHSETLGPGVGVTHNRYNTAKSIYYWGVLLLTVLTLVAFVSSMNLGGLDRAAQFGDSLIARLPKILQIVVAMVITISLFVSVIGLFVGSFRFVPWLQSLVVPPVPFT